MQVDAPDSRQMDARMLINQVSEQLSNAQCLVTHAATIILPTHMTTRAMTAATAKELEEPPSRMPTAVANPVTNALCALGIPASVHMWPFGAVAST
jgi:hypothetical protein